MICIYVYIYIYIYIYIYMYISAWQGLGWILPLHETLDTAPPPPEASLAVLVLALLLLITFMIMCVNNTGQFSYLRLASPHIRWSSASNLCLHVTV